MGEEDGGDEDIEKHVKRRFEICQRLGKGAPGQPPPWSSGAVSGSAGAPSRTWQPPMDTRSRYSTGGSGEQRS